MTLGLYQRELRLVQRRVESRLLFAAAALAAVMAVSQARAEVGPTTLKQITTQAHVIALARVEKVERIGGVRIATAVPLHPLNGLGPRQRFAFLAEGTWECDASDGVAGETVLLFLSKPTEHGHTDWSLRYYLGTSLEQIRRLLAVPLYEIAHAGFGRMPVHQWRGEEYVRPFMDLGTDGVPPITRTPSGSIRLADAESLVRRWLPTTSTSHYASTSPHSR